MSAAETKKYRVTKKWPGGPEVGYILIGGYLRMNNLPSCKYQERFRGISDNTNEYRYSDEELQGFVEEVKEPEEFWYMSMSGVICSSSGTIFLSEVPPYLRFKTKEACERFRDGLSDSYEETRNIEQRALRKMKVYDALDQRVTK